jgi:hypothetical protein
VAEAVKGWIAGVGARTAFIEKASPLGERIRGKLQRQAARRAAQAEVFNSLREAQVLIEQWRRHHNTARPHSASGYRPPAPEVLCITDPAWAILKASRSAPGRGHEARGHAQVCRRRRRVESTAFNRRRQVIGPRQAGLT